MNRSLLKLAIFLLAFQSAPWMVSANPLGHELWKVATPWIGTFTINKAQRGELVTLTFLTDPGNDKIPVARSYDGRDWELSPGPFADIGLSISCSPTSCDINVSNIDLSGNLYETSYTSYVSRFSTKGKAARVARFLEQATCVDHSLPDRAPLATIAVLICTPFWFYFRFGGSTKDTSTYFSTNITGSTFKSWIVDQISKVPMTSHREFYRQNTNPK